MFQPRLTDFRSREEISEPHAHERWRGRKKNFGTSAVRNFENPATDVFPSVTTHLEQEFKSQLQNAGIVRAIGLKEGEIARTRRKT